MSESSSDWIVYRGRRSRRSRQNDAPSLIPPVPNKVRTARTNLPRLVNDVYQLIYRHLDDVTKTMMCLSSKSLLKLGIPRKMKGEELYSHVVSAGYLNVLKYLHHRKFPRNSIICAVAAENGHLKVLQWLREHKYPWDSFTCYCASLRGHFAILRWIHTYGCPWSSHTVSHLASHGSLHDFQWAIQAGAPWNDDVYEVAARNGHLHILKYAHQYKGPSKKRDDYRSTTCANAAQNGHLKVIQWLHGNGYWWTCTASWVAAGGHLECLQWAIKAGCHWKYPQVCSEAAAGRPLRSSEVDQRAGWYMG